MKSLRSSVAPCEPVSSAVSVCSGARSGTGGYSLIELLFVTGLIAAIFGMATGVLLAGLEEIRTSGAARYVAGRLQRARTDAVFRGVNTAVRFVRGASGIRYGVYMDGNGDGVRTRDIERGVDPVVQSEESLPEQFPGVEFGALPDLPPVDTSSVAPGTDPIRLGSGDMASFTPLGTSSSGSVYILGPRQRQYVVRLLGETGKYRILKFNARTRQWEPL